MNQDPEFVEADVSVWRRPVDPEPGGFPPGHRPAEPEAGELPEQPPARPAPVYGDAFAIPVPPEPVAGPPPPADQPKYGEVAPPVPSAGRDPVPLTSETPRHGAPSPRTPARLWPAGVSLDSRAVTVIASVVGLLAGLGLVVVLGRDSSGAVFNPGTGIPTPVESYTGRPADEDGWIPPDSAQPLEPPTPGEYRLLTFGQADCVGSAAGAEGYPVLTVVDCADSHSGWEVTEATDNRLGFRMTEAWPESVGACVAPIELGTGIGFRDAACHTRHRELYYFDPVATDVYRVRSAISQYCMSVTVDGAVLQEVCTADDATQEFTIRAM